jgi:hypothetical protein
MTATSLLIDYRVAPRYIAVALPVPPPVFSLGILVESPVPPLIIAFPDEP